jgi:hypothetical protein
MKAAGARTGGWLPTLTPASLPGDESQALAT